MTSASSVRLKSSSRGQQLLTFMAELLLSNVGIYPHWTKKLDADLFQLRKERPQRFQLILSECLFNGCLGLLPQGCSERKSFTPLLGDTDGMLSSVAPSTQSDQPIACENTHVSSNGRTITSQLLGKVGKALLSFLLKNASQKHILRHLETTGCKDSIIGLGECLCCVAQRGAMTGKCPFHNASIYPHVADVKGLSELRTQNGSRSRRVRSEREKRACLENRLRGQGVKPQLQSELLRKTCALRKSFSLNKDECSSHLRS